MAGAFDRNRIFFKGELGKNQDRIQLLMQTTQECRVVTTLVAAGWARPALMKTDQQ